MDFDGILDPAAPREDILNFCLLTGMLWRVLFLRNSHLSCEPRLAGCSWSSDALSGAGWRPGLALHTYE